MISFLVNSSAAGIVVQKTIFSKLGDICNKRQVFEALNYLGYRFSIRANPFHRVCLFHFYGICNRNELTFACCSGKIL